MLHDFNSNLDALKRFQQAVILDPTRWHAFSADPPLQWRAVKFGAGSVTQIPEQPGIYAFVGQFQDHSNLPLRLPPHGYVMYVGIAGHRGPERTLRDRFRDYLRERGKRLQIFSMLTKWTDDLFFHFAAMDDAGGLDQLEIALNDAVIPPYVSNDFSAEVRRLVRVLKTN